MPSGVLRRRLGTVGVPQEAVDAYLTEAPGGDYDQLLRIAMAWVDAQ